MLKHGVVVITIWLVLSTIPVPANAEPPKNVILMIGDGMGFEQVRAARYFNGEALPFELFPHSGQVTTYSADAAVTDSAAAATAMATGVKVNNGVLSMAVPGNGTALPTLLEIFQGQGKSTGLVTSTTMTHATPAAFGAHETSRTNYAEIADDYFNQTRPNVLFGGAHVITRAAAELAGYAVVESRAELNGLNTEAVERVSGQFGSDHLPYEYDGQEGYQLLPHLSEMARSALEILDNDPDGLFLMIEGGRIDHAGHENHIQRNVAETIEFARTLQQVMDWANGRDDTLVLVTADHETGGLSVTKDLGRGFYPEVDWLTGGHTAANVPVYAWGANSHLVGGLMDNTDMFRVATVPEPSAIVMFTIGLVGLAWVARRTRKRTV